MNLVKKQIEFAQRVGQLITFVFKHEGYGLTLGEAHRPKETAMLYAKEGRGIKRSNHLNRLAIDLFLFKNGVWLKDWKDYEFMGVYWESLSTVTRRCCWGGRFKTADAVHFSFEHNGVK